MEAIYRIAEKNGSTGNKAWEICMYYAAINGHAMANFLIARKEFLEWKPDMMMLYLRKAVELKEPEAENFLAQYLFRFDQGTPVEIFKLYQRAWQHGYVDATAALSRCYWFGFGTARDQKKAFAMAKEYLEKYPEKSERYTAVKMIAGLGYLKFDKNKEKGLQLLQEPDTELGVIVAECVYYYGLYGVPQSLGIHDFGGGLAPHWAHLDVFEESYHNELEKKIKAVLFYQ